MVGGLVRGGGGKNNLSPKIKQKKKKAEKRKNSPRTKEGSKKDAIPQTLNLTTGKRGVLRGGWKVFRPETVARPEKSHCPKKKKKKKKKTSGVKKIGERRGKQGSVRTKGKRAIPNNAKKNEGPKEKGSESKG